MDSYIIVGENFRNIGFCHNQDTYFESNSVQKPKLLVDQRIFEAILLLTEQALQNFCQALLSCHNYPPRKKFQFDQVSLGQLVI